MAKPLGNETADELDWYKPVAVILKPATNEDLLKRFQLDQLSQPEWPPVQDYSPFDPWTPYESRSRKHNNEDKLREFYETYNLPGQVEGNLLSIARMGLVAIPRNEIGQGSSIVNVKNILREC